MKKSKQTQSDKFKQAASDLETDNDEKRFDKTLGKIAKANLASEPKCCPECGHVFQGNGWDGIDAHWKSKHDHIMPYAEAWPLIKAGTYQLKV